MAVVHETLRIDWLEVACRNLLAGGGGYGDRLDPVEGVLEFEEFTQLKENLMRQQWIGWRSTYVQEKRPAIR